MAVGKPTEPEAEAVVETELPSGFSVMNGSELLGTYSTEEEAEAFAEAHPRAAGLKVTIVEG